MILPQHCQLLQSGHNCVAITDQYSSCMSDQLDNYFVNIFAYVKAAMGKTNFHLTLRPPSSYPLITGIELQSFRLLTTAQVL
jgi:hypothetical protein